MSPLPADRDRLLDTLRAGAVLYIVGFWHLFDYVPPPSLQKSPVTELLTYGVLGLFCFLSGYLLADRYAAFQRQDSLTFYRRRLLRIYPLYALALIGFLATGLIPAEVFWPSLSVTNLIWLTPLPTLWFVSLILMFYGITPLYLMQYSDRKTIALTLGGCLLLGMPIVFHWPYVDYRLPLLLPAFAGGILIGRQSAHRRAWLENPWVLLGGLLLFALAVVAFSQGETGSLGSLLVIELAIVACLPILWQLGQVLTPCLPGHWWQILSYSSFVAYLLHRITFRLALWLYQPTTTITALLYLLGIGLPVTIGLAYLVQRLYDQVRWR